MKPTREGKRFLLGTALIAVAALNTGNNLIYLILSLMLSFVLLSFVVAKINLSGLGIDMLFDGMMIAGVTGRVRLVVTNARRFIPAYSVRISADIFRKEVPFHRIEAGKSAGGTAGVKFERRGLYREITLTADSSFPFILFSSRRRLQFSRDLLVHPSFYDIDPGQYAAYLPSSGGRARPAGDGHDIFLIRDYRYGDDPRRIHWKASAKRSLLMTREYAEEESTLVTIVLDNSSPAASGDFEKAVSITASAARLFTESEALTRVVAGESAVPFGTGREHLQRILDMLAIVREDGTGSEPGIADEGGFVIAVLKSHGGNHGLLPHTGGKVVYADTV